jgi:hypothetical protein
MLLLYNGKPRSRRGGVVGGGGVEFAALETVISTTNLKAAHSWTRRLLTTYEGNLIEIRRDSDDAVQAIGAGADWLLDEAAIASFCGAANGYVRTVYDQSGNGNNAVQTTTLSKQPLIYDGSAVVKTATMANRPAAHFNQDWMDSSFAWGTNEGPTPTVLIATVYETVSYLNTWNDINMDIDDTLNQDGYIGSRQGNSYPMAFDFGWTNYFTMTGGLTVPHGKLAVASPLGSHSASGKRLLRGSEGHKDTTVSTSRLTGTRTADGICYGNGKPQASTTWANMKMCETLCFDDYASDEEMIALADWQDEFFGVTA